MIDADSDIVKTTSAGTSVAESPVEKRKTNAELVDATLSKPQPRVPSFRETCLRRDSYQCVVTKQMDCDHWENLGKPPDVKYGDLEAAHIIPFAYASWHDSPVIPVRGTADFY